MLGWKVAGKPVDFGELSSGYMPLNLDTFAMGKSCTAKEHVGRTMQVSTASALGSRTWAPKFCLELALRPGT